MKSSYLEVTFRHGHPLAAYLYLPRQPGETLADWLSRATADATLADLRDPLQKLLRLHYRYRFDPRGIDAAERRTLRERSLALAARLKSAHG